MFVLGHFASPRKALRQPPLRLTPITSHQNRGHGNTNRSEGLHLRIRRVVRFAYGRIPCPVFTSLTLPVEVAAAWSHRRWGWAERGVVYVLEGPFCGGWVEQTRLELRAPGEMTVTRTEVGTPRERRSQVTGPGLAGQGHGRGRSRGEHGVLARCLQRFLPPPLDFWSTTFQLPLRPTHVGPES